MGGLVQEDTKNNRLLEECKAVNNDKFIISYQYDNNGNTIDKNNGL